MALIRWEDRNWDPFRELEEMSSRLNRALGRTTRGDAGTASAPVDFSPSVNIAETDKQYVVSVELPQVRREDVRVTLEGSLLTVRGERKHEREEKGVRFHRVESFYGSFARRFTLPDDVDASKLEANFKDGMLNILVPKLPATKPAALEVKIS